MNLDRYPVIKNPDGLSFEFYSEGPKGSIKKIVQYQSFTDTTFNLLFGDLDENSRKIMDYPRSNNGDRDKILVTVASTVIDFMKKHPGAHIFAKGETPAKTRLYQMAISKNWEVLSHSFVIKGLRYGYWESFRKGKNYDAFVLEVG